LRKAKVTTGLRARSLQVHGRAVDRAVAGQRVAVNLPGIDVADIPRGSALSGAGTGVYRQGPLIDAEVELVPGARPLPNRGRLTLHLGTAQALATVDLLGRSELEPGERVVAQLRLDRALPAVRNQRFVLRGYRGLAHGGRTAAGGRILLVDQRRRRKADQPLVEGLRGEPGDAAAVLIREAGLRGIDPMALRLLLALPAKGKLGPRTTVEAGGKLFDRDALVEARTRLADIIRERETLPREEARAWLGPAVSPAVFDAVVAALGSGFVAGEVLSVAERVRDATEVRLEGILLKAALTPPTAGELADATTLDRQAVGTYLRNLVKAGLAVRLTDDLFVHAAPAADFRRRAVEALKERGSLTTLELKEMSGASRKFAIPLCEWLDREHVTVRVGEKRTLRGGGK